MVGGLGVEGDEGGARVGEVADDAVHGGHLCVGSVWAGRRMGGLRVGVSGARVLGRVGVAGGGCGGWCQERVCMHVGLGWAMFVVVSGACGQASRPIRLAGGHVRKTV